MPCLASGRMEWYALVTVSSAERLQFVQHICVSPVQQDANAIQTARLAVVAVQTQGPPLVAMQERLQQELTTLLTNLSKARAANELIHGQKENLMQLLLSEKRRVSTFTMLVPPDTACETIRYALLKGQLLSFWAL